MLSGPQLLGGFDDQVSGAQREAAAAQQAADALVARRDALRAQEAQALRELAQIWMASWKPGDASVIDRLDTAAKRALVVLEARSHAVADADAALAKAQQALYMASEARDAQIRRLHDDEAAHQQALRAARDRISADPQWRALREAADDAAQVAQHAGRKARAALDERVEKGRPYLADPIFAYLWNRGFGTPAYRAGFFTRMLDRWAARVARYDPARVTFALLTELPGRLAEHAARMEQAARDAEAPIARREGEIAGIPAAPDGTGHAALEAAEAAVTAAQQAVNEAQARRTQLSSGGDASAREATDALEAALRQRSLRELRAEAARTPVRDDDDIVARLEGAASERMQIESRLDQAQRQAEAARGRLREVMAVRQEALRNNVARDRWNMTDGAMVGVMIGELLRGGLSRGGFWQQMQQHRVPAQGPWTGGGVWNTPAPQADPWNAGPWGGGGRSGGFGGGGFQTGGTMEGPRSGGGGFKTGGGF